MSSRLEGDWDKASLMLMWLPGAVADMFHAKLYETGELVLERIKEHIDRQDLGWVKLAKRTIDEKGHDKAYIDTGEFKEGLTVRRLSNTPKKSTILIGASPWKTHTDSGLKYTDLMIYLEYGSPKHKIPARPLIRPTWEEVEKEVKKEMIGVLGGVGKQW